MIVSGQDNEIALGVKTSFLSWIRPYKVQPCPLPPGPFELRFKYRAKQALEGSDRGSRQ